jgi:hemin uptake protein HemP
VSHSPYGTAASADDAQQRRGHPADGHTATGTVTVPADAKTIDSAALFGGGKEIIIRHAHSEYRLRITRADKLILTK